MYIELGRRLDLTLTLGAVLIKSDHCVVCSALVGVDCSVRPQLAVLVVYLPN